MPLRTITLWKTGLSSPPSSLHNILCWRRSWIEKFAFEDAAMISMNWNGEMFHFQSGLLQNKVFHILKGFYHSITTYYAIKQIKFQHFTECSETSEIQTHVHPNWIIAPQKYIFKNYRFNIITFLSCCNDELLGNMVSCVNKTASLGGVMCDTISACLKQDWRLH
jgi:hypothetical protein